MKIRIDKEYTSPYSLEQVKGDMISFKHCFTNNDLYRFFCEQVCIPADCDEVLKCEVEAFSSGCYTENHTAFRVELVAHGFGKYVEISYFCDSFGTVDTSTDLRGGKMYRITTYKAE